MSIVLVEFRFALVGIPIIILIGILLCVSSKEAVCYIAGFLAAATYEMLRSLAVWIFAENKNAR